MLFRIHNDRAPHTLILGQLGVHNDGRLIAAEHGVQRLLNLLFQLALEILLVFQVIARRAHQPIALLGEQGAAGVRDGHVCRLQPTDRVGHDIGNALRLPGTKRAVQLKRNGRFGRLGFPPGKHALLRERDQDLGGLHLVIAFDDTCQILLQRDLLVQVDLLLAHHGHIRGATRHKGVTGHLIRGHDILLRERKLQAVNVRTARNEDGLSVILKLVWDTLLIEVFRRGRGLLQVKIPEEHRIADVALHLSKNNEIENDDQNRQRNQALPVLLRKPAPPGLQLFEIFVHNRGNPSQVSKTSHLPHFSQIGPGRQATVSDEPPVSGKV